MDGKFTQKAILVAVRHKPSPPPSITHSIVVTRESVRLELIISGMKI